MTTDPFKPRFRLLLSFLTFVPQIRHPNTQQTDPQLPLSIASDDLLLSIKCARPFRDGFIEEFLCFATIRHRQSAPQRE